MDDLDQLLDDQPLILARAASILARRRGRAGGLAAAGAGARAGWARLTPAQRQARLATMAAGLRQFRNDARRQARKDAVSPAKEGMSDHGLPPSDLTTGL